MNVRCAEWWKVCSALVAGRAAVVKARMVEGIERAARVLYMSARDRVSQPRLYYVLPFVFG